MAFAWRDRSGRVRKLIQGGADFIPWPWPRPIHQLQEEEVEEITRDTSIINARSPAEAWRRLILSCAASRRRDVEKDAAQRTQEDTLGACVLADNHEITSRKRKVTDEQEQELQNLMGQDNSESDAAEQGLQNLFLSLPCELVLHKVLLCLPLPKIFELRCVSRDWNSLLRSPHFVNQCLAAQQGHEAWLVMAGRAPGLNRNAKEFIAFVPSLGRWIPFPLPCSPPISAFLGGRHAERLWEGVKLHNQRSPSNILMASAGGLICCIVHNVPTELYTPKEGISDYTVLVFNPVTGHMKTLPPFLDTYFPCIGFRLYMLYDQAHNTYKVFVFYDQIINVYDSKSGSWKITCPHSSSSMGILDADLFFYKREDRVYTLYGYHMQSDTWSSLIVPAPQFFEIRNGGFFLEKLNGRVLLAYDFRPSAAPSELQGFTVWELHYSSSAPSAAAWVQVAWTPPKFWNRFHDLFILGDLANDTTFITSGRLLCMTVVDFKDNDYGGSYSTPLVFDLHLKSWYRLPPYKGSRRFMGLFSFHPTLNLPM